MLDRSLLQMKSEVHNGASYHPQSQTRNIQSIGSLRLLATSGPFSQTKAQPNISSIVLVSAPAPVRSLTVRRTLDGPP